MNVRIENKKERNVFKETNVLRLIHNSWKMEVASGICQRRPWVPRVLALAYPLPISQVPR